MAPMMMAAPMMEMDDAPMPMAMGRASFAPGGGNGGSSPPEIRIRKSFPETWIWTELETEDNKKELIQMVPDTITSWIINAFQISPTQGIVKFYA